MGSFNYETLQFSVVILVSENLARVGNSQIKNDLTFATRAQMRQSQTRPQSVLAGIKAQGSPCSSVSRKLDQPSNDYSLNFKIIRFMQDYFPILCSINHPCLLDKTIILRSRVNASMILTCQNHTLAFFFGRCSCNINGPN